MPATINGVGTMYYGKDNAFSRAGVCPHCNRETTLSSYDTGHWFVVIFVPLIPLGKKHIHELCGSCRKHRVIDKQTWDQMNGLCKSLVEKYRFDPQNSQLARQALQAANAINDPFALEDIKRLVLKHLDDDIFTLLMLAAALSEMLSFYDAQTVLNRILMLDDSPTFHALMGNVLLKGNKPDEALSHIMHAVEKKEPVDADLFLLLGHVYEEKGLKEEAQLAYDNAADIDPELGKKRNIKKKLKLSHQQMIGRFARALQTTPTQYTPTHQSMTSAIDEPFTIPATPATQPVHTSASNLEPATQGPPTSPGNLPNDGPVDFNSFAKANHVSNKAKAKRVALIAAVFAILFSLVFTAISLHKQQNRDVFLVNGLPRVYHVTVNGQKYKLYGMTRMRITVPEGIITVTSDDPLIPAKEQSVEIASTFFKRPFDKRVFVLNPDHAAVLQSQDIVYSNPKFSKPIPPTREQFVAGRFNHTFINVDYLFVKPPDEIKLGENQQSTSKHCVELVKETETLSYDHILTRMLTLIPADQLKVVLKQRYLADPDNQNLLYLLTPISESQEMITFLEPLIDQRPIHVPAHQIYQYYMEQTNQSGKLFARYSQLLSKEPQNKDILYLSAHMVSPDQYQKKVLLYQKAAEQPHPNVQALLALAKLHAENGLFEKAISYIEQGWDAGLSHDETDELYLRSLEGAGQKNKAIAYAIKLQAQKFASQFTLGFSEQAYLLQIDRKNDQAKDTLNRCRARLKSYSTDAIERYLTTQKAILAYAAGNRSTFVELASRDKDPNLRFAALIANGDTAEAMKLCQSMQCGSNEYLLIYIASKLADQTDLADKAFDLAIKNLEDGSVLQRELSKMLAWKSTVTFQGLLHMSMGIEGKLITLTAMGMKYPQIQKQCFEMARKLNFDQRSPYLTIQQALSTGQ